MQRRRLSSAQTFFIKIVFPVLWIGVFGAVTFVLFFAGDSLPGRNRTSPPPETRWFVLGAGIVGSAVVFWSCGRLKRVDMDDRYLLLSNYREEIRVPLAEVVAVHENRWLSLHPITLEFRRPTPFGERVVFMPNIRFFGFWSSHPVVAEIRQAVERLLDRPSEPGSDVREEARG